LIRWTRRTKASPSRSKQTVNPRLLELQTAKQILREIFHARSSEVDEMIQRRLEEKNWNEVSQTKEEELWPREFCAGE
jgi:hypothetical protein